MSKSFDIIMAGLISGIVALTTSFLGLAGTVIGAVLGAILYQVLSIFIKEPLENSTIRKVENGLVFIIPLVLIAIFLVIFIIALLHSYLIYYPDFLNFFIQLEQLTNNNLVRFMGIGLILMGIYPLIQPKVIKREYGFIILILGIVLLIRGLLDLDSELFYLYTNLLNFFDVFLVIVIFLILIFVIIKIFLESVLLYMRRNSSLNIFNSKSGNINNTNDQDDDGTIDYRSIEYKYMNYDNMDYDDLNNITNDLDNNLDKDLNNNLNKNPNKYLDKNLNKDLNKDFDSKINQPNNKGKIDKKDSTQSNKDQYNNNVNNKIISSNEVIKSNKVKNSNKTIKSDKTSTMSKNRKYFKH
nr:CvpA family protein [Methanobrevibacter arboriphilus]